MEAADKASCDQQTQNMNIRYQTETYETRTNIKKVWREIKVKQKVKVESIQTKVRDVIVDSFYSKTGSETQFFYQDSPSPPQTTLLHAQVPA